MKNLVNFILNFGWSVFRRNRQYIRLTPIIAGLVFLYDKRLRTIVKLKVRNAIDLRTLDQVFTRSDYDLKFLRRYELLIDEYYTNTLKAGKTPLILDLGANVGYSALYFSRIFPKADVVGVEPEKGNYNTAKNQVVQSNRIVMVNAGVGSAEGHLVISDPEAESDAFQTSRVLTKPMSPQAKMCSILTVDKLLELKPDGIPFIVKIDIEGFEKDLFESNTAWVDQFPIIIIELHDWLFPGEGNSANFLKVISESDRDFVFKGENVFSIRNKRSAD